MSILPLSISIVLAAISVAACIVVHLLGWRMKLHAALLIAQWSALFWVGLRVATIAIARQMV